MRFLTRPWFRVALVTVTLAAVGYAVASVRIETDPSGTGLIATLGSNDRFLIFVALPVWLIAASSSIERAVTPLHLLRHGTRRSLLVTPLQNLLAQLLVIAAIVSVIWSVAVITTVHSGGQLLVTVGVAAATFGAATALMVIGFSVLYWMLLTARLVTGSRQATVLIALIVWVFSTLPNVGVFAGQHPLNMTKYVSVEIIRSAPNLVATLLIAATIAPLLANTVARWKDDGSPRPAFRRLAGNHGGTAMGAVCLLAGLGALGVTSVNSLPTSPLASFFAGVGGPLLDYLVGMTVILLIAIAATARFADDWIRRAALHQIRYRTTTRWVTTVLVRNTAWACLAVLAAAAVVVTVRFASTPGGFDVSTVDVGSEIAILFRVMLTVAVFILVLTASVIVSRSDAATGLIGCTIVVVGLIPALWTPWNPLLAWSAQWHGENAVIALASALILSSVTAMTLFFYIRINHESEAHRVDHRHPQRIESIQGTTGAR